MTTPQSNEERNGDFLDSMGCCKVCDGEIPYGHTDNCDIWKLEKRCTALQDAIRNITCRLLPGQTAMDMHFTRGDIEQLEALTALKEVP